MKTVLKVGVLGCSNFAMRSIIPTIQSMPDCFELFAISSRTLDKSKEYAQKVNIKRAFGSYDEMLDLTELDVVYIPLPIGLHFQWAKKALNKKLHVLVEKSMTCTYEETKYLNNLASKKKCVLMENFQFRFHKQLSTMHDIVADGGIGDIRCIRSSFGIPPFSDKNGIRYQKKMGGGALLETGAYPIKISQLFLGLDIKVSAANLYLDKEKKVDIWGGAYLQQNSGELFAEVAFGFDNFYQCNIEIWGSKGKLSTGRIFTAPPDFSTKILLESTKNDKVYEVECCNHFKEMLSHFYNLITTKKGVLEEYSQNINQSRLISETLEAASIDNVEC